MNKRIFKKKWNLNNLLLLFISGLKKSALLTKLWNTWDYKVIKINVILFIVNRETMSLQGLIEHKGNILDLKNIVCLYMKFVLKLKFSLIVTNILC